MKRNLREKNSFKGNNIKKSFRKKVYGYARVSTKEQNPERQIVEFLKRGISQKSIFLDKESGKNFNREKYQELMRTIKEGDVIVIKSLDRLGRNYEEITNQWRKITKEIKANIEVIDMPLLNTNKNLGSLGMVISDIVLQLLSFVAQNQLESIHKSQAEGIANAKAQGIHCGRPRIKMPKIFKEVYLKWKEKRITGIEASKLLGISRRTFRRRILEMESGQVR